MKDLMHYQANEKMVNNCVFWNNVWNVISLVGVAILLYVMIKTFSEASILMLF